MKASLCLATIVKRVKEASVRTILAFGVELIDAMQGRLERTTPIIITTTTTTTTPKHYFGQDTNWPFFCASLQVCSTNICTSRNPKKQKTKNKTNFGNYL